MNNERGFVTIFALCLIIVVALVVRGIQESDANRNKEADILLAEFDLQNAADGGIYEAAEKVRVGKKDLLPASNFPPGRKENQRQLVTRSVKSLHGTITVKVWGERLRIQRYWREYNPTYKKVPAELDSKNKVIVHYGYVLFSVAQLDNPRFGKLYRRAVAYVVDGYGKNSNGEIVESTEDADPYTVHFVALPSRKDE